MQRTSFSDFSCSVARTLDVVGEWWTPLILRDIFLGVTRFDAIQKDLSIPRKVLSARLAALVANGVLVPTPYRDGRLRNEYHLTERGHDFVTTLIALMNWGDRWLPDPLGRPLLAVHDVCGGDVEARLVCKKCGGLVGNHAVGPRAGPGAKARRGTALVANGRSASGVAT